MRILILTTAYSPLIGGSEIAIEHVTRSLPDVFFDIVTPKYNHNDRLQEEHGNITIHRIGPGGKMSKWLFPFLGAYYSAPLIRKHGHKAAHVWQASWAGGAAWMLFWFGIRVPVILTLQEGNDLGRQPFYIRFARKLIAKRASTITAISSYLLEIGRQLHKKADLVRIPNGIDASFLSMDVSGEREQIRASWNIPTDAIAAVTVSRLVYKNAVDTSIRALLQTDERVHLIVIGDGVLRDELTRLADALGVATRVHFLGLLPNEETARNVAAADMFVRPSRSEGLGIAFLEAMALRIPVIATRVGGIKDFLIDGETGLSVAVDSSEEVAQAMKRLVDDAGLRTRLIENAHALIEKEYTWQNIAKQYQAVYDHIQ